MCVKDKGKSNIYKPFMPDQIDHSLYQNKNKSIKNMEDYHINRVTKYAINRILTFFNIKPNKSPYRKIRIMRTDSREIKNSNEINNYLVNNGFEIIYLENYNITQQLQMIADSKIVFGSHGSGLVNCIALSPKSKLIEVCPKQYYLKKCATNYMVIIQAENSGAQNVLKTFRRTRYLKFKNQNIFRNRKCVQNVE